MSREQEEFKLEWENALAIDRNGEDIVVEFPSFMKDGSEQWRFWMRTHGGLEECELCFALCEPVKVDVDNMLASGVDYTTCYYCAEEGSGAF